MSTDFRRLVFTDLDGSLLDHHSYSFAAAAPLLAELEAAGIPVIPVSSKTRAEIAELRARLDNRHPFIVENGAAVFIPDRYFDAAPDGTFLRDGYWVKELSGPRQQWLDVLSTLRPRFAGEFDNFHRAGPPGIVAMTGLSEQAATLANQREYSEPVQWLGDEAGKLAFIRALNAEGACALQGGRFLSVSGDCDKGRALTWLRQVYQQAWGVPRVVDIAIGDSGNDVAMLAAAGTALLIRSPVHPYPELGRVEGVMHSVHCGPEGWAEGVGQWLLETGAG